MRLRYIDGWLSQIAGLLSVREKDCQVAELGKLERRRLSN
jgi:hypothetical protein